MICDPGHKHGRNGTCYHNHKCRCTGCNAANTQRQRDRRAELKAGTYEGHADVVPVLEHVRMLRESGMTIGAIAERAGVAYSVVSRMPQSTYMFAVSAQSILAVRPRSMRPVARRQVDSTGTRRRLEALMWLGWTSQELSRRLGKKADYVSHIVRARLVFHLTAEATTRLYDGLWATVPPASYGSTRVKLRARRNGWVGPLAWDDDTIDNPYAVPVTDADPFDVDDVSVEAAVRGDLVELNPSERREAIIRLTSSGWSTSRTATQLGCSERTVTRIRTELGLTPGRVAA